MKTLFILCLIVAVSVPAAMGKTTPTPAPMVMPTPTAALTPETQSGAVSSTVALAYSNGEAGSLVDLSVVRPIDENDVSAEGRIRFGKSLSSSDGVETVEVREANISLSEPWFEARAGRMDLSGIVSPTSFFGRYPLMGERRLDGIKVYIPFKFSFGLEDDKGLSSPPTSLSFFYFPTLLAEDNAVLDGSQGFFMGQARMKLDFGKDLTTVLLFNMAESTSDYFTYGSLSGNPSYSICGKADLSGNYELYFEYGVEDSARSFDTNAFTFGARIGHLFSWEFLSLDEVTFESQVPLCSNLNNPFTGGNGINPSLAGLPQMAWYGKARIRIRSIFIDLQITNSMNDFTLARLNTSNTNFPLPLPVGKGNETDGLELPLSSTSYVNPAVAVDMGVSF